MSLARFAAGRAMSGALFALVVASLTLALARAVAGDVMYEDGALLTPEERAVRREELGLDRPWLQQYGQWLSGLARLDFGTSSHYRRPVRDLLGERAANTALLAITALILATAAGVPLGRLAGAHAGPLGRAIRAISLALLSVPPLLSALLLVYLAARSGWLPAGGMTSGGLTGTAWLFDVLKHLPVPALALALPMAATLERLQARAMADTIRRPFVTASRARGLARDAAYRRHAWPVSLAPVLGTYGVLVGALFSGSFVVEVVTGWPGLGRLLFDGLRSRDVWLVAGCGAAGALSLAIGTTVADLAHAAIDPRVLEGRRT
ncbi:MAG: ABC transporter permease [Vicinamibacterales bacterium]